MLWRIFLSTFGLVFLAELGDKTQLATMLLVTQNKSPVATFFGASVALICSSFVGVACGTILMKYCPTNYLQNGAGVAFILIGIFLLFGKL